MNKKLIITPSQFSKLTIVIKENNANLRLKNKVQTFLEADYESSGGVKEIGNEFYNTALIKKKVDGNFITPKALKKYMKHKFDGLSDKDLDGCIEGWFHGDYDRETGLRKKK
jgi:hypothetical protein